MDSPVASTRPRRGLVFRDVMVCRDLVPPIGGDRHMTRLDVVRRTVAVGSCPWARRRRSSGYSDTPRWWSDYSPSSCCAVWVTPWEPPVVSAFSAVSGALVGLITTVGRSRTRGDDHREPGRQGRSLEFLRRPGRGFWIIVRSVVPPRSTPRRSQRRSPSQCLRNAGRLPAGDHVRACGESGSAMVIFIVGLMLSQGSAMSAMPFAGCSLPASSRHWR